MSTTSNLEPCSSTTCANRLGKVGTVVGCDTSNCGACTVLMAGPTAAAAVKSCSVLAVQADGGEVTTVEGLAGADGTLHPVQQAFHEQHALQCGFCTPGMIMAAVDLLRGEPGPHRGGDPRGLVRQPLPLHRLPEHRPRGPARGRGHAAGGGAAGSPSRSAVAVTMTAERHRRRARGRPRRLRKEDARLITGRTRWTDNITLPGMLHLAILRSPYAHARITQVDVGAGAGAARTWSPRSAAPTSPTTRACSPAPGRSPRTWSTPTYLPLAVDEVRHVGEPVAVVVARDRASAVDALEAIEVEYEPLPVVLDLEEALADGAPLVHAGRGHQQVATPGSSTRPRPAPAAIAEAEAEAEVDDHAAGTSSSG